MFAPDLFIGSRVLITGGGSGLGRMMADTLLAHGAAVEIWGRRTAVLAAAAAEMNAIHPGQAAFRTVDIRDAEAVDAAVQASFDEGRPLTALINNAAGNFISRTEDLSPRAFRAISDIVFHGTFSVTQAVGRRWIAAGAPGAVVSIVVTWVWTGAPFVLPSAMSKAGIDAMTKSLAVEWGRYGIRLNCIAPGLIPTEGMLARLRPGETDPAARAAAANPLGRVGTAEDIGNLTAFLLSRGAGWLSGQTIALDGGNWLSQGGGFREQLEWGDTEWAEARARISARTAADKTMS